MTCPPSTTGGATPRICRSAAAHGLRKACARRLAEAGVTASQIAAVTGHETLAEVQRYTAAADRSGLADAAMGKLIGTQPQQKVANHPERFAKSSANMPQSKEKS